MASGLLAGRAILMAQARTVGGGTLATREPMELVAPARNLRVVLNGLGEIRCRLVGPDGTPWAGEVTTRRENEDEGVQGWTGKVSDGVVRDEALADGRHVFLVEARGHTWTRRVVDIRDGSVVDLGDLRLDVGVEVSGRVVNSARRPVAQADVECVENEERATRTDADGRFSFQHFPRERVTLRVVHEGHVDGLVVVEPARTTDLGATLWRPATLRGVLRSEDGNPMPRAKVELRGTGTAAFLWGGQDGKFHLQLTPGTYRGYWKREGQDDRLVGEWTVAEGEVRDLDVIVK